MSLHAYARRMCLDVTVAQGARQSPRIGKCKVSDRPTMHSPCAVVALD
eukprot:CAMPEP_0203950412 /NCGR_PEP_ID=MMETSP0359-20131031/84557_1 /ASSEMBLY_ACC=CAM_ASM_000338 /TAXON_ID=268821 /ORGANISM="Scrippsiella Hangoei, Strain SHTV-5" /LENGTH=47 /DNA_ID= /DNA_START= /DNA_END= /DNA_ORIENTATION=